LMTERQYEPRRKVFQARSTRRLLVVATPILLAGFALLGTTPAQATTTAPQLKVFAGNGTRAVPVPGAAANSPFEEISAEATDQSGDLFVADAAAEEVMKITPSGQLSVIAGSGVDGTPIPGQATSSPLGYPAGLAVDPQGDVFISDYGGNEILKVTPSGTLSVVGGDGTSGNVVPGPASSSPLHGPWGLAIDSSGDLYIGFYGQDAVAKLTASGTISIVAGNSTYGSPVPGPALNSPMGSIGGIAVDSAGNLYLADYYYCDIYKVTPSGTLSIYAGTTTCLEHAVPGPATSSPIGYLYGGMALDWQGNLYFTDVGNDTLDEVNTHDTLSIVAGTQGSPGAPTPGPAADSKLDEPYGVTIDSEGNLFVADTNNYRVDEITGAVAPQPIPQSGYWMAGSDGGVFAFGTKFYGSAVRYHPVAPIVGITSTVDGQGYWLVGRNGGVFSFGDAGFHGSLGTSKIDADNIVGIAADTTTGGYWLVASNGGVFSYDAPFFGSLGNATTAVSDIVGIAPTANDRGYYLVGSNGAVYPFGTAKSQGEASSISGFSDHIVGISVDETTGGYWEVGADGGVFAYGAPFHGSMGGQPLNQPVVSSFAPTDGTGYGLVASDGGAFAFGPSFLGSMAGHALNAPVVGAAAG
jgi:NHL repeat